MQKIDTGICLKKTTKNTDIKVRLKKRAKKEKNT